MSNLNVELCKAAAVGSTDRITAAVKAGGDINAVDSDGKSALYHVVKRHLAGETAPLMAMCPELGPWQELVRSQRTGVHVPHTAHLPGA